MPTTEPHSLTPDRERAFWEAVQFLGLDPQASALTLVRGVLTLALDPLRATAFGAAAELKYHIDKGRPVQFLQRPATRPIAEVMPSG